MVDFRRPDSAVPHSGEALLAAGVMPMAPGPYFDKYFRRQRGHSVASAAQIMGVAAVTLQEVLVDARPIDRDLANRLSNYTAAAPASEPTTPEFWLSLQAAWDYAREKLDGQTPDGFLSVSYDTPDPP